jgi:hypothetical protein
LCADPTLHDADDRLEIALVDAIGTHDKRLHRKMQ